MFDTNTIPRNHVPGVGRVPSEIMLVGEAPGGMENNYRRPFVGPSGDELDRYLRTAGLSRTNLYVTNLAKYWPPHDFRGKQLPPSKEDIERDAPELRMELDIVRPRIIAAVGAHSARHFLGKRFKSMRRDHGIPRLVNLPYSADPVIVLPIVHPAAGIHATEEQVAIQWDFQQLGYVARGQIYAGEPFDEYPDVHYERFQSDDEESARRLLGILAGQSEIGIDTEGWVHDPWCLTFSVKPGTAYMIMAGQRNLLAALHGHLHAEHAICTIGLHHATHDIPVIEAMGVSVVRRRAVQADGSLSLRDTMSEAYLLGGCHPKGLKALGWRLCGAEMDSYEELVGPTEQRMSREYVERVFNTLMCETCCGTGRGPNRKVVRGCADCGKTGKVPGKRAGTFKQCKCVKTTDKCAACLDGMILIQPDREYVFDNAKGEFRWKQPQSIARWIKKRLEGFTPNDEYAEDPDDDQPDADDEDEPANEFFKLRKDWEKLEGRADWRFINQVCGPMPVTRLSDVPDQEAVTRYACRDADITLRVMRKLPRLLEDMKLC
jgi:uracil-DNA glycosylase family 4